MSRIKEPSDGCCENVRVQLKGKLVNTYRKTGSFYQSWNNQYIVWSNRLFSWLVVNRLQEDGNYQANEILMRILASEDKCLIDKTGDRKKRDLVSNNFMDKSWRWFSDVTKMWTKLDEEDPDILECLS